MAFPPPQALPGLATTTELLPSVKDDSWGTFEYNNLGVLGGLVLVLAMVGALWRLDTIWNKKMNEMQKASGVMKESYAFALNMVRHFMPSWKVEKYQFRGMQAKSETVNISFEDLSLELPSGARVLQGVTGKFTGGRMCATFPSPGLNMMTTTEDPPSQWEELGLHERTMDQVGVVIALICILLLIFLFYHLDRRWTKKMRDMQAASGLMKESSAYALNLVRHFMPSWKLEKYQFRGLQAKETRVSIAFEDLNLEIPSGALVLQGVTGAFTGGRMCAIMGPSGAGKTTFMNVLCG
eukprot:CAMPEP_0180687744 /NCGR_PEP_ID=MMETSP1037_2-20121125/73618_1 /TAXON_ID=632150 /ORGANISM="Azadinium spinosum, Strain 3D9" /LENGTH=294 /DNA_ID=CAMNT_0022718553 /DNA_START=51 /DNA_END=931 /DNA_ORIENTATION=+